MIPQPDAPVTVQATETPAPGGTWRLSMVDNPDAPPSVGERVCGPDPLGAVRQAVWLALNTPRCRHAIYSWNYGVELDDLFGEPLSFCKPELERRIRDALSRDDRVTGVDGFVFTSRRGKLTCTFTVRTVYGAFAAHKEIRA